MSTTKKRVLVISDYFHPAYKAGGAALSVTRIVDNETESLIRVVTRNHDIDGTKFESLGNSRSWVKRGAHEIAYLGNKRGDLAWVVKEVNEWKPEKVYLNSLFSPWATLLPLFLMKLRLVNKMSVTLAPRGETSKGALAKKALKKRFFSPILKVLFGKEVTWHLSSQIELQDLVNWFRGDLTALKSTLIEINPSIKPLEIVNTPGDNPSVMFASRIDRKKGLIESIEVLGGVRNLKTFNIYGACTDAKYLEECISRASSLLPAGSWKYFGDYGPDQLQEIFETNRIFLFTTHGENFGHVIAESLAHGTGVAMFPGSIWDELIESTLGCHLIKDQISLQEWIEARLDEDTSQAIEVRKGIKSAYEKWYVANQQKQRLFF